MKTSTEDLKTLKMVRGTILGVFLLVVRHLCQLNLDDSEILLLQLTLEQEQGQNVMVIWPCAPFPLMC